MQTGTETLGEDRDALVPLSATVFARPARICVFVPAFAEVAWETAVEHVLALQARYWGGHANLVVPLYERVAEDPLFWSVVRLFDPDLISLYAPTWSDVAELAPDVHERGVQQLRASLEANGFGDATITDHLDRTNEQLYWNVELPRELEAAVITWASPFHHDEHARLFLLNGRTFPHEAADALLLAHSPQTFRNFRIADNPLDQLVLTSSIGRFTPAFVSALRDRGVTVDDRVASLDELPNELWPRHATDFPSSLPAKGLAYRARVLRQSGPVLVVGEKPRDWFLYRGLQIQSPATFWLPTSKIGNPLFMMVLHGALLWEAMNSGGRTSVGVLSAADDVAAQRAVEALSAQGGAHGSQVEFHLGDWHDYLPSSPLWLADPASVRTMPLLRSGRVTEELAPPIPAAFRKEDLLSNNWIVDVDVNGWNTFQHRALGPVVLPGPFASSHDQRISSSGPSFFGLAAFVQSGLGVENALSRRRLAPLPIVDALAVAGAVDGWTVEVSDKGAYASRSAGLFDGVDGLANALRNPKNRAILDTYLDGRRDSDVGCFLTDTRRRYLSLADMERTLGADAEPVVSELYDRGVFTRGHVLKCERCRSTSFHSLTEDQEFTCRRCRLKQRATRRSWLDTPEPLFRYELAEVVFQFLHNNGDVPLLAAYDYFVTRNGARDKRPIDLGFEVQLRCPDGELSEHDIVAAWGADLWIGEATREANLGDDELARLRRVGEVARTFGARGVLLATTNLFSSRTRGRIETVFREMPQIEIAVVEELPRTRQPEPG